MLRSSTELWLMNDPQLDTALLSRRMSRLRSVASLRIPSSPMYEHLFPRLFFIFFYFFYYFYWPFHRNMLFWNQLLATLPTLPLRHHPSSLFSSTAGFTTSKPERFVTLASLLAPPPPDPISARVYVIPQAAHGQAQLVPLAEKVK